MTDGENRTFYLTIAALIVVLGVCFPLVRTLDDHMDQSRDVYLDLERMAELQYKAGIAAGEGTPVELGPGETAQVGTASFTASPDVSVTVTMVEHGYCVTTENSHGDGDARCWHYVHDPQSSEGYAPTEAP